MKNDFILNVICNYLNVNPELSFTGGDRGWVGDNPFIFLDTSRIKSLGWSPKLSIEKGIINTLVFLRDNEWVFEK